jgi:hypothetical protein
MLIHYSLGRSLLGPTELRGFADRSGEGATVMTRNANVIDREIY